MSILDRITKVLVALKAISWDLLFNLATDIVEAFEELWQAIRTGSIQGVINAVMRLVGMVETVISQVGQAITAILDALRTSNTGDK